jgi:hypothetical protein
MRTCAIVEALQQWPAVDFQLADMASHVVSQHDQIQDLTQSTG